MRAQYNSMGEALNDSIDEASLLMELTKNRKLLYTLTREQLKTIMKNTRYVKEKKYKRNRVPKYRFAGAKAMPFDDVNKFFAAFQPHEYRIRTLFATQCYLGLRIGEVVQMKLEDLDFQNEIVRIKTEKTGFFTVLDSMAMHAQLKQLLLEYIQFYEKEIQEQDGYLFFANTTRGKNKFITSSCARNVFRRVCKRAGLTDFYGYREPRSELPIKQGKLWKYTTHSLRYAFARFLHKENGVPLELMQLLMRHTDINSTRIYCAPDPKEANKELHRIFARQKM